MIGPIDSSTSPGGTTSTQAVSGLTSNNFLQLMVAQLQYQDPFQPMDASSMLQQTSSLTTVQNLQEMASLNQELLGMQEANTATGLIGTQATTTDASGNTSTGEVTGVAYTSSGPMLEINGQQVPLGQLSEATLPGTNPTTPTGNGSPA